MRFKLTFLGLAILMILGALYYYTPKEAEAANSSNNTVSFFEGEDFILYYGTIAFSSDSTANHFTKAMDISECNNEIGGLQVVCSNVTGTEDVNVTLQYSNYLSYFHPSVTDSIDNVAIAAKIDSVGADPNFYKTRYMRLKADGQAGNPAATVLSYYILLDKKARAPRKCAAVYSTQ